MKLTKNDMASVIVQALYLSPKLPAADNVNVMRMARRMNKSTLQEHYKVAHKIPTEKSAEILEKQDIKGGI